MGLDMYFYATNSFGNFHESEVDKIYQMLDLPLFLEIPPPYIEARLQVGYMRKANHIHNWIIENLANGLDECQIIYLSVDDLKPLKEACEKVIDIYKTRGEEWLNVLAPDILPTRAGFFFGSYDYDEGYIQGCKEFLEIYKLMSNHFFVEKGYTFHYEASW